MNSLGAFLVPLQGVNGAHPLGCTWHPNWKVLVGKLSVVSFYQNSVIFLEPTLLKIVFRTSLHFQTPWKQHINSCGICVFVAGKIWLLQMDFSPFDLLKTLPGTLQYFHLASFDINLQQFYIFILQCLRRHQHIRPKVFRSNDQQGISPQKKGLPRSFIKHTPNV